MNGVLEYLKPDSSIMNTEAEILFSGIEPTSTGFNERQAFRHYLKSLKVQCYQVTQKSFDDALKANREILNSAENLLSSLDSLSIRDSQRDFSKALDSNRGALSYLENTRGAVLRRKWNQLV